MIDGWLETVSYSPFIQFIHPSLPSSFDSFFCGFHKEFPCKTLNGVFLYVSSVSVKREILVCEDYTLSSSFSSHYSLLISSDDEEIKSEIKIEGENEEENAILNSLSLSCSFLIFLFFF
jgi:hypothetical protein